MGAISVTQTLESLLLHNRLRLKWDTHKDVDINYCIIVIILINNTVQQRKWAIHYRRYVCTYNGPSSSDHRKTIVKRLKMLTYLIFWNVMGYFIYCFLCSHGAQFFSHFIIRMCNLLSHAVLCSSWDEEIVKHFYLQKKPWK